MLTAQPPPTDPWAPGARAADVPVCREGEFDPFMDPAKESKKADAPLHPNKFDIAGIFTRCSRLRSYINGHPDAWVEIAFAKTGRGNPTKAENFSAFDLEKAPEFAEEKNKAGFNIYVGAALRQGAKVLGQSMPGTNAVTSFTRLG